MAAEPLKPCEDILEADLLTLSVGVDQRAAGHEERRHAGPGIGLQSMGLARRLVDEGPLARHPIVLEISPRALERERVHRAGVIVALEPPARPDAEQVGPGAV